MVQYNNLVIQRGQAKSFKDFLREVPAEVNFNFERNSKDILLCLSLLTIDINSTKQLSFLFL